MFIKSLNESTYNFIKNHGLPPARSKGSSLPFLPMLATGSRFKKSFFWIGGVCSKGRFCATVSKVKLFKRSKCIWISAQFSLFVPCKIVASHFCYLKIEANSFTQGVSLSPFCLSFPLMYEAISLRKQALRKTVRPKHTQPLTVV